MTVVITLAMQPHQTHQSQSCAVDVILQSIPLLGQFLTCSCWVIDLYMEAAVSLSKKLSHHLVSFGLRPVSGYTTPPNTSGKMQLTGSSASSLATATQMQCKSRQCTSLRIWKSPWAVQGPAQICCAVCLAHPCLCVIQIMGGLHQAVAAAAGGKEGGATPPTGNNFNKTDVQLLGVCWPPLSCNGQGPKAKGRS